MAKKHVWNSENGDFELVDMYDGIIAEGKRLGFNIRRPTKYTPDRLLAWLAWAFWGIVTLLSIIWLFFGGS